MRILVVEDEPELRDAIARRLRALGHAVDESPNAADADANASVYEHSLVILDRMLPGGDSITLLRAWRAAGRTVPVLFLTARDAIQDRVEGFESGADDYLVKPFAMDELVARVTAIGRREPQASTKPILQTANVTLDSARREVKRAGVVMPLRPKEFAVLELLLRNAGRVVSRERILDACWDEAREPASNVEEVIIASLRRKLGKPDVIATVRGAGYRIEVDADHE